MFGSIAKRARALVRRYRRDEKGNIAIMAAMLALPMLAISGAAVDFSRAVSARSYMGNALDSALLALARLPAMPDQQANAFVKNFVGDVLAATRPSEVQE